MLKKKTDTKHKYKYKCSVYSSVQSKQDPKGAWPSTIRKVATRKGGLLPEKKE